MNNMSASPEDRRKLRGILVALVVFLPVFMLWGSLTVTVPSGYAGLTFHTFGEGVNPEEAPLKSGFHFKAPWNKVYKYEIRQTEQMEALEVLSSNLLKINMDMTVFTQPQYDKLGYLEIQRGRDFEEKVIRPAMRSVAREVIAKYLPEEFNTTKREQIQLEIKEQLASKLVDNYIQLNDVLIRNIQLPVTLEKAIERKLQQEQESLEYKFRLEKAEKEADRLRIEAAGIRDFEEIISKGLSEKLLKWKGIEATKEIAKSNNSKVVIVGGGEGGLPIILGND
jgi:regulator of protease activity HflC (stomatin/prohibitin superfamily)|tara:strand:- start:41 stop:883 length:843 start_codon:yes stop_codon:yes gene_type:complete